MVDTVTTSGKSYKLLTGLARTGSASIRNPMMSACATWGLLLLAHLLSVDRDIGTSLALALTGALFISGYAVCRRVLVPALPIPDRDIFLLVCVSLTVFAVEAIHFGLPLLGGARYDKFGFPVAHHLVWQIWLAPLLARRRNTVYLIVALSVGMLLFNRQLMLLATIGYLLRMGVRGLGLPFVGLILGLAAIGVFRTASLGISLMSYGGLDGLPLAGVGFLILLYVLGPYYSSFGMSGSADAFSSFQAYWNTMPEWMIFTKVGIPAELSLGLFYTAVALAVVVLTRCKLYELRLLGILIHVLAFMTFFSNVLLSTPLIAAFLVLAFIRRTQGLVRPDL